MALQAMWVHGHSAHIELNNFGRGPGEDLDGIGWTGVEGHRIGPGVRYGCQGNTQYWFHFAIPTPVIVNDIRAHLRRVTVLFDAPPGVTMISVQVWDGLNLVFTRDGLAIGGANQTLINERNSFALPDWEVFWGIGVSVLFHFANPGIVTLHTAGVDFDIMDP